MAVEDWMVEGVRTELDRAVSLGETRSRAALQERCGIGAGDIGEVLEQLRSEDEAREVAPGEWEKVVGEEVPGDSVPTTAPGDELAEELPQVGSRIERAPDAPAPLPMPGTLWTGERAFMLSRPMVAALDAETLGKMIAAGVEAAGEHPFVLRVEPA